MISGPIKAGLFAAIIVGFASYLAETSQPVLAGLLSSLPVALPAMWFLNLDNESRFKEYAWAFALGITGYFIASMLFYYMYSHKNIEKKTAISCVMGFWLAAAVVIYLTLSK